MDIDVAAVAAWLGQSVEVREQATTGASNVTWLVDVDGEPAVLRHPPIGPGLATAHDLAREQRFLVAVAGTSVPVPKVLAFCEDASVGGAPFLVVERMPGTCLLTGSAGDFDAASLSGHAIDVLAAIHGLDWSARGLSARSGSYLQRQIDRWHTQLDHTPTAARLGTLGPLRSWLHAHRPADEEQTIVHGDYGFHNLLVEGGRVTAVLDWELATIGDPIADVMACVKSWGPDSPTPNGANDAVALAPGAPDRDQLLARYEAATGRSVGPHRDFYELLGVWKSIGILEGIHARSGGTAFVEEVPELVSRAYAAIGRGEAP